MTGSGPRLFDLGVADRLGDERGLFFCGDERHMSITMYNT